MFLTQNEARTMSRNNASLPWLFPLKEHLFPDVVARAKDPPSTLSASTGGSGSGTSHQTYQSFTMATFIKQYAGV